MPDFSKMSDREMFDHDERIYLRKLAEWGVKLNKHKYIVLNGGLGDHIILHSLLNEIREKYKDYKLTIAVCYPEVFKDDRDIKIISIADAHFIFGNLDKFSIYKWCIDHKWDRPLIDAFREMYLK
jgi:hypothetical protein